MIYVVHNKETGWTGTVTEEIYRRCKAREDVYEVEAVSESEPEGAYVTYTTRRRKGPWFDVVGPGGAVVNDKAMREADADALAKRLNDA